MQDRKVKEILEILPQELKEAIYKQPAALLLEATELRFRVGQPIQVITQKERPFVKGLFVTPIHLKELFQTMCNFSVYAHQRDIENGFITLKGGHRAGIVGTAVQGQNGVSLRNISSMNIRIAREHIGSSKKLHQALFQEEIENTLIVGPPLSGKTTLIRDLTRLLCEENKFKVSLIDERDEIANVHYGKAQNNVGQSCDILTGYEKETGILTAIRTMSPEVIVCDELGDKKELEALNYCVNAGAKIVATIHGEYNSKNKQFSRRAVIEFIESGIFTNIVFLKGKGHLGEIEKVIQVEKHVKNFHDDCYRAVLLPSGI